MKTVLKCLSAEKNGLAIRLKDALDHFGEDVIIAPFGLKKITINIDSNDVYLWGTSGIIDSSRGWDRLEYCLMYAKTVAKAVNLDFENILIEVPIREAGEEIKRIAYLNGDSNIVWEKECAYGGIVIGTIAEQINS